MVEEIYLPVRQVPKAWNQDWFLRNYHEEDERVKVSVGVVRPGAAPDLNNPTTNN